MKETAVWLYQQVTNSHRAALMKELREADNVPIAILFYHRVADGLTNDWTISRSDFARQLDWLQENFDVVSLQEAQRRISSGGNSRPTVSITFDDGYGENADFAIPQLVERGLPATYFVATDFVETNAPFPHDLAQGKPLRPNTVEELRDFASWGIEIGAHTRTHRNLGTIRDRSCVESEVVGSAEQIKGWLQRDVAYFAFPFGLPENTSQLAVDVIAEYGFRGFCTAYGAWNWPRIDNSECRSLGLTMHLRRIHADPGLERLKNWLTLDRRKLADLSKLPFAEPFSRQVAGVR